MSRQRPTARSERDAEDVYDFTIEDDGVRRVVFSVMTASEVRARSACEVASVELFSGGNPVEGGLYDTRMGVVEFGQRCATCHHNNKQCPGHPGHIELAVPVFNSLFIEYTKKILRCVCFSCARACFPESYVPHSSPGESALTHASDQAARVKDKCARCGAARPERLMWNKTSVSTFTYQIRGEEGTKTLTSADAYDIFGRIPDRDCRMMGLNPTRTRPDALMFKALPVTPVAVRPPHRSGTQRRDDDITHKLSDIIKTNRRVRAKLDAHADPGDIVSQTNDLQLDIMQLVLNSGTGGAQARMPATNRPLKSIASRLKGKEGRVRNNLMGKRVDFSARSVISAEPSISVDEVGVPVRIAMTLTFPEIVHAGNIDRLRKMVSNGPHVYPGARMLRRDGVTFSLERPEPRVRTELRAGDVVERHIVDGDVVLFNRQPSLHRMSMMCHRVRVMPHDTLRLNVLATEAYNADFDGDETNIHLPQCAATAIEISRLASVKNQIISPRHHRPIIGVVQDVALGVYLLTQDDVHVDLNTAANICARCSDVMPVAPLSGRQLFSSILPSNLHCELSGGAVISFGDLLRGSVGKAQYQQEGCGILHSVFAEDGPDAAVRLLDSTQSMTCDWLMRNGHSMGAADIVVSAKGQAEIERLADGARKSVAALLEQVHAGTFVNESSGSDIEALERAIVGELDTARDAIANLVIAEGKASGSRLLHMVGAKSKGNPKNVVQMAGILGQNLIDGGRMPPTLGDRTLPHFHRHDIGADARGFIPSSFREGLRPHEFFFHAMAGREGLIDTAVKTADCGYLQRRFVKALEDLQVASDGSVRDAAHNIVSFRYGADGMDACAVQTQRVPSFGGNLEWMAAQFLMCRADDAEMEVVLVPEAFERWKRVGDAGLAQLADHFRDIVDDKRFLARVMERDGANLGEGNVAHAIAFFRIIQKWGRAFNPLEAVSDLDALDVLKAQESLISDLYPEDGVFEERRKPTPALASCARSIGAALIRVHLNPKRLIRSGVTTRAFESMCGAIRHRFYSGLVSPSEMVGIIAAQSIAEPSTQMTLNSFAYDTTILLCVGDQLVREDIGAYVDREVLRAPADAIENHPNDTVLAWLRKGPKVHVRSCDEQGKITWRAVEAVTRHPVVNADGSDTLLRVRLTSGREVVATKAKSFLRRVDNQIVPVAGEDLAVGDYLPVSIDFSAPEWCQASHFEVANYFQRCDLDSEACAQTPEVQGSWRIPLDRDFGWFVGAYLAVGYTDGDLLYLDHLDEDFIDRCASYMRLLGCRVRIRARCAGVDARCCILANAMRSAFGVANKRLPAELLAGPQGFAAGVVEGVFDGDGHINTTGPHASVYSPSAPLLQDVQQLLARFRIRSAIGTFDEAMASSSRGCTLQLDAAASMQFRDTLELTVYAKRTAMQTWGRVPAGAPQQSDVIPDVVTRAWGRRCIDRADLPELLASAQDSADRCVLEHIMHGEDVFYDRIASIEEVPNTASRWVYDLTVEGPRTFSTYDGVQVRDTFHSTGASNKASVPRVKELVAVSKNPKITTYTVRMLPGMDTSADFAGAVRDRILSTHVRDLVAKTRMVCENGARLTDTDTRLHNLEAIFDDGQEGDPAASESDSAPSDADADQMRFVLRIELDRGRMAEHAVSTLDVHTAIFAGVHGRVVAADDAAEHLVVRVTPHVHLARSHDLVAELREMESRILDTRIKGVAGVTGCDVVPPKGDGERVYDAAVADYVPRKFYTLEALAGSSASVDDILDIASIPGVDPTETYGDNLWHTIELFGIEAARTLLLRELQGSYAADTYADFRHIELLVDFITRRGVLTAITRHGVGATEAGPLTKCSFEQTVHKIVQAGMFGETDHMTGVSANVMMGQTTPCGTGNSRILWDLSAVSDLPDGDVLPLHANASGARVFRVDAIAEYSPFAPGKEAIPMIKPGFAAALAA